MSIYCDKDSQGAYAIMGMNLNDVGLLKRALAAFKEKTEADILSPYTAASDKIWLTEQLERAIAIISHLKAIQ
jgi:hypothetical protein